MLQADPQIGIDVRAETGDGAKLRLGVFRVSTTIFLASITIFPVSMTIFPERVSGR